MFFGRTIQNKAFWCAAYYIVVLFSVCLICDQGDDSNGWVIDYSHIWHIALTNYLKEMLWY